ncbi:MAG: DUF4352 domain-containing protein [Gordonia sp. (in: high G+C Gram-positive bacteria)]
MTDTPNPAGGQPPVDPHAAQPTTPYGVPPQFGTPLLPPPPKKKRKWPWIVGAVVVLLIIIAVATSGGGDAGTDSPATAPGASGATAGDGGDEQPAALNTPVRDGKFEFVVTNVESGLDSVGDNPYLTEQAQGQFVIVTITVKNIGDRAQGFSPTSQKLFDAQGRSFEPSTTAQIALGDSDIAVWDNINPGNTVTAKVVYDMPDGASPATIELHDSSFSGGVEVALR